MDQVHTSLTTSRDHRPVTVPAPHEWDGIGQALRAAYREHRGPPEPITSALARLDTVD